MENHVLALKQWPRDIGVQVVATCSGPTADASLASLKCCKDKQARSGLCHKLVSFL